MLAHDKLESQLARDKLQAQVEVDRTVLRETEKHHSALISEIQKEKAEFELIYKHLYEQNAMTGEDARSQAVRNLETISVRD